LLIGIKTGALRQQRMRDIALRFALGGIISAAAAVIAALVGPRAGGVFLAFPAILPASLTLVAKHHEERKRRAGVRGVVRARQAAALDAFGAILGSVGLLAFALTIRAIVAREPHELTLAVATAMWLVTAALVWGCRRAL
jgi:hypothetical protein